MPRPFGTDRVELAAPGHLRVTCSRPKDWVARRPAERGVVLHPGAAVRWEEELWEVVAAGDTPEGGAWYELAPWDDQHAIRVLFPYDDSSEAIRSEDRREAERRRVGRVVALLLSPVVGLLPGHVQERLEVQMEVRATTLTLASIPLPFGVGVVALLAVLMSLVGAAYVAAGTGRAPAEAPIGSFLLFLVYLFPESLARFAIAMGQGRPMGSVLGLPLFAIVRLAGLAPAPAPAGTAPESPAPDEERLRADRFLMLEPLLSFLPPADQQRLAAERGFAPVTWGKRTAWFLLVYPGLTAPAHAARLLVGNGGLGSVLLLALALGLGVEQVVRLRTLSRGEPAPSVLGRLVAPFAAPLLR
ncbi:MAG: hypothetical protein RBU36_08920 [Thermoanaerobaculia bacterium]|nr:hypothetical protein [Thermoanaerobaculia bacterium]